MRFRFRLSTSRFALVAVLAGVGFVALVAFELWIDRIAIHAASVTVEINALQRYLQHTSILAADRRSLDDRIARLHLIEDTGAQSSIVTETMERLARRRRLQMLILRREPDATALRRPSTELRRTLYSVVFQGGYASALLALKDLATAPLVSHVQSVAFERAQRPGTEAGDVRMSFELAVYRISRTNVSSGPS